MNKKSQVKIVIILLSLSALLTILLAFFFSLCIVSAAPVHNHDAGIWSENFNDTSGLSANVNISVNTSSFIIQLTNSSGGFTPPYNTSGYIITTSIIPTSVVKWANITFNVSIPVNTSIKIQVLDEGNYIYNNTYLLGNTEGFLTSPVNITNLSVTVSASPNSAKFARLRIKIILTTNNTNVTPTIGNLTLSWIVRKGNLNASSLASTSWPNVDVDNNGTRHSSYYSNPIYPAIRWAKNLGVNYGGDVVRGFGDIIYLKAQGGIKPDLVTVTNGRLFAINRTNGESIWEREISGQAYSSPQITLSQNNTLYNADQYNDIFQAYDTSDGSLKWTYQFYSTHGSDYVTIGDDGTLYTIRYNNAITVYAFYPNGSIKWTNTTDLLNPASVSRTSFSQDGNLLFGFTTSNNGQLYKMNSTNGFIIWNYSTGDIGSYYATPVVDSNGVIYVASASTSSINKSIFAIYNNGTLKWKRDIGVDDDYYNLLSLRSDGVLLAEKQTLPDYITHIEAINASNGSLLWEVNFTSFFYNVFSDSINGFYLPNRELYYYDSNGTYKWNLYKSSTESFSDFISQDENGNVYNNYYNSTVRESKLFSIHPWTLSVNITSGTLYPGNSITFNITTSMQQTNLLTGNINKIQVIMDNGEKVQLNYSSNMSSGDTLWTGIYTLPSNITNGNHSFTVEASAAGIRTDINTSFDSSASNSNNTGINLSGSYFVSSIPVAVSVITAVTGGGGIAGISWSKTFVIEDTKFEAGYTKELGAKERLKVTVDKKEHYVGVVNLTSTTATIDVSSNKSYQITMSVGEEKKFEVTEDNFYDIYVKLNNITNNKASINVKSIHEEIPAEEKEEKKQEEKVKEKSEILKDKRFWLVLIIVVAGALIVYKLNR